MSLSFLVTRQIISIFSTTSTIGGTIAVGRQNRTKLVADTLLGTIIAIVYVANSILSTIPGEAAE